MSATEFVFCAFEANRGHVDGLENVGLFHGRANEPVVVRVEKDKRDDGHHVRRIPWKRKVLSKSIVFAGTCFSGVSIRD
jgi:hypothetical protein